MKFVTSIAYFLSILRLPYAIAPYLLKFSLFAILRNSFSTFWNRYEIQIIRVIAEFLNLFITSWAFDILFEDKFFLLMFFKLVFIAESIRLLCEKGITVLSVFWQLIPHQKFAKFIAKRKWKSIFHRYSRYYILSDEKRLVRSLSILRAKIRFYKKHQTEEKLRYVTAFRVVSDDVSLRSGKVRDVTSGEIYIHARWLNSLDLLFGLALRRSPWIFDPRYLRRPFYYRSEANPLMTRFVFENAILCPVFAVYQFGHEIKSARYEIFYKFMRWLGFKFEQPVCEDGTNQFDIFAKKLLQLNQDDTCRPLWTDDEVIRDLQSKTNYSALEIAETYIYPFVYVSEILSKKL